MPTVDYRKLCLKLFGTDDVKKLSDIAKRIQTAPVKQVGRKRKFTDQELQDVRVKREQGMSIQSIADEYHTSRQVVSKYLNQPLTGNYTMRLIYMYGRTPCTRIDVDFLNKQIQIQNETADILHRAFGVKVDPTWEDFEEFLMDRCIPPTRGLMKYALADLGLDSYDTLQIVEKTQGRVADDRQWIKIQYRRRTQF